MMEIDVFYMFWVMKKGRRRPQNSQIKNELVLDWNLAFTHASWGDGPWRGAGPRDTCWGFLDPWAQTYASPDQYSSIWDMFDCLGAKILIFNTCRSTRSVQPQTRLSKILSHASETTQILNCGSLSFCVSFSTFRHLEPHFCKPSSLGSTSVIKIHSKRMLELVLNHLATF